MNKDESEEILNSSVPKSPKSLTLQKAIELGEYNPDFLSSFPEFLNLSPHSQFQMVREAIDNRRKHLLRQWAEINNMLDFSKKPHLQEALTNIESQLKKTESDREKIYVDYSKK